MVEIDSIEIDGQKGRARRIFDDDVNYDVVGKNAALSFDDSIVERIKLMKDVEDESLVLANDDDASAPRASSSSSSSSSSSRSSGASIVLVELESGEEIDFNSREDDKDATMNDAEDEEGMEEGMVNKQKSNGREVEIVMRFRSGNYPSSVSNVNAANDGGIVAIDAEDNAGNEDDGFCDDDETERAQRSFWSSSSSSSSGGSTNKRRRSTADLSVACDGEFFKAPGTLEKPSCWFPCVDVHDCLTEFDFSISCVPHLVAIAPGQFEEAAWEPEVSDIDGQFRRRHTFRSCVPCVARDVCVLVGPFSAHRAYRDTTIETVDPNALPINPFARTKKQATKITHEMQSKDGITKFNFTNYLFI